MTVKKDDQVILEDIEREIAAGSPAVAAAETEIKIIENSAGSPAQTIEPVEAKTAEVQEGGA
jgi:hypothetical protein